MIVNDKIYRSIIPSPNRGGIKGGVLILIVLSTILLHSCKKDNSTDLNPNLNVADNIVIAEEAYNHVVIMTIRALKDPLLLSQGHIYMDSGYVIFDSLNKKISFNYYNRLSPDSITRSGKFDVWMSGNLLAKGSYARILFTEYSCDGQTITGNDSIVNAGIDGNAKMVFENFITGGVITQLSLLSLSWQSSNRFTVDPSVFTVGASNYYVLISGEASGISTEGFKFGAVTKDSLIWWSECPWLAGDKISFSLTGVDVTSGTIKYNSENRYTDDMEYDFEGNLYYTRMSSLYLKH